MDGWIDIEGGTDENAEAETGRRIDRLTNR